MEVSPEAAVDSSSGEQQLQNQNNGAANNNVNHRGSYFVYRNKFVIQCYNNTLCFVLFIFLTCNYYII